MPLLPLAQLSADPQVFIIGTLAGLAISIPIFGLLLLLAVRWVTKVEISFGRACLMSLITILIGTFAGLALALVTNELTQGDPGMLMAASAASSMLTFFVSGVIYGNMIKDPDTYRLIGPAKGLLVALVAFLLGLLLDAVFAGVVIGVLTLMGMRPF